MLFNSFEFLVFLPIVFMLYWFVFRERRWQNLLVVVASYVFYGWWDWRFLLLIALTSFFSYASGLLLERHEGQRQRQRVISATNIVLNLSILGVFKYYNFFVENLDVAFGMMGFHLDWVTVNIILPVGISFYTFQALSYTIDVYQKKLSATHDVIEFFAYISFFPQLVAGPIERATNLLPQFQQQRHFDYAKAVDGMRQMLWGYFKKLVVADNCAVYVNAYWDNYNTLPGSQLLLIGMFFSFQIYCDFSGYSDIAIGCARLFGVNLMRNFHYPYYSRNISEFWRRWHVSLMKWFTDYVYIPLGGSRCGRTKTIRNTLIVFLVSGLWHGANWTYICWGLYHASLITLAILLGFNHRYQNSLGKEAYLPSVVELSKMLSTFIFVVFGWIIFRATSIEQAYKYIARIFSSTFCDMSWFVGFRPIATITFCFAVIIIEWVQRDKQHALDVSDVKKSWQRFVIYSGVAYSIYCFMPNLTGEFIYFQF